MTLVSLSFAERLDKLKGFGLTVYQARVYLALLALGTVEASQVPPMSKVPRTRIYSTMNQLHERGLVEVVPEKPMKYRPVPFGIFLDRCIAETRSRAEQLEADKTNYDELFAPAKDPSNDKRGRFEVLYGRRNVQERIGKMYEEATGHIISVGTISSPHRIVKNRRFVLEELAERGVSVRYVFPFHGIEKEHLERLQPHASIRLVDQTLPVSIIVIDGREAILNHPIPNDDHHLRGEDVALWTNDDAMVAALSTVAQNIFDCGSELGRDTTLTPMLNSIRRFVQSAEVDPGPVLRLLGAEIGSAIGKRLHGDDLDEVLAELARYFEDHQLGTVTIVKDQPVTVTVERFFECSEVLPHLGDSLCHFVESVVEGALRARLGDRTPAVRESRCFGTGSNNCRIKIAPTLVQVTGIPGAQLPVPGRP